MLNNWRRMTPEFAKLSFQIALSLVAGLIVILALTGCLKKSGMAMVMGKEHINAKEVPPEPKVDPSASPAEPVTSSSASPSIREVVRKIREDEIEVDGYVMKKEVRGTGKDPRAMDDERWIVNVQMVADLRQFNVETDRRHWEKVKIGDRIAVSYRQGKYTGAVWSADID
jgi:hypothetical protein